MMMVEYVVVRWDGTNGQYRFGAVRFDGRLANSNGPARAVVSEPVNGIDAMRLVSTLNRIAANRGMLLPRDPFVLGRITHKH